MSLLLDALKKAAEKKAGKSQQAADAQTEATQVTEALNVSSDTSAPATQEPDYEAVMEVTAVSSDDATQIDKTQIDKTEIDKTEIDKTHIDQTHLDATHLDATELDSTRVDATQIDATQIDATELDKTHVDATHIDATQIDATQIDQTEIDKTQVDQTHLDSTRLDATQIDATHIDSTQIDATLADVTELDKTHLDATHIDATQIDATHIDKTEIDKTHIDQTQLDHTYVDSTHLDATHTEASEQDQTQLDRTMIDATEYGTTEFHIADHDATDLSALEAGFADESLDKVAPEREQTAVALEAIEQTDSVHRVTVGDADIVFDGDDQPGLDGADGQMDETDFDLESDTTSQATSQAISQAASTTRFSANPSAEDSPESSRTVEMKPVKYLHELADAELLEDSEYTSSYDRDADRLDQDEFDLEPLTFDDVTQFMGDGIYESDQTRRAQETRIGAPSAQPGRPLDADDTTITNSESLSLTNFGYDQNDPYNLEGAGSETNLSEFGAETRSSDTESIPDYSEDSQIYALGLRAAQAREAGSDGTRTTNSSVDIAQLTNDQTVTFKESTSTRTFAPDNYDRTLLKLADQDVSRIFPGMKAEQNSVMTPDYAKKVFINKSQTAKRRYYLTYLGLGIAVLAAVLLWGMDTILQESDAIDNSLVRLRNDPLPGDIKKRLPGAAQAEQIATAPLIDRKAMEILATAQLESDGVTPVTGQVAEPADMPVDGEPSATSASDPELETRAAELSAVAEAESAAEAAVPERANNQPVNNKPIAAEQVAMAPSASTNNQAIAPTAAVRKPAAAKASNLTITSSQRVDEKDRLLGDAYGAYASGDFERSASLYGNVLQQAPSNRDALLGLAAIQVRKGQSDRAIANYRKVLLDNPKDSVALASLISVVNVDPANGESEIKKLLTEQPDAAYLHFVLGNMYGSQMRWQEAQKAYFEALRYKPQDPNYAYNLAVSLEHIEQPRVAATFYQRALDNLSSTSVAVFDSNVVSQRIQVLTQ